MSIEHIFAEAVALHPAQRSIFLDKACADDPQLRARVEALLAAHNRATSFLELPPPGLAGHTAQPPIQDQAQGEWHWRTPASSTEAPGNVTDRYKLLQLIGEGGFGSVWMAEQREPIQRKVALKIIKLGMDTRQVVARFEAERQALAMMDHPGVAKVFDAGATATGRPYFVMELVKGVPITEYCDKHILNITQRLELFVQVCQAVQHAHQKGIIHRDIKPSNVLVGTQDGRAMAKVIDFGIAKATQSRLTEKTLFTEFHQLIGTPAYMSPEQAEGSLDVDTRSDVYGLGVLLYELLTGTTPFDTKDLMSKAYAEIQRIIREVEPPKPSTRLSQYNETLAGIAAHRATEPRKLGLIVRGELDWIVMRALEKDRGRRFETANALAMDVQRYLAGEPVVAAPPSRGYRLRKFVKRNRAAVIAVGTIAAVLVAGIIGTTIGLIGQARERAKVEQQADIIKAVLDFQSDMLKSADPEEGLGDKVTVLQVVTSTMTELDKGALKDQPLVEARVRETIGGVFQRLGRSDLAEPNMRKSLDLRRGALPRGDVDIGRAMNNLAWVLTERGNYTEAEPLHREAILVLRSALPAGDPEMATSLGNLGLLLRAKGEPEQAEQMFREALDILRRKSPPDPYNVAVTMNNLAMALLDQGKFADAESYYKQAMDTARPAVGRPLRIMIENGLANVLLYRGQFSDAEQLLTESLEACRKALPQSHPSIALAANNLGSAMEMQRKFDRAETLYTEALRIAQERLPAGHSLTAGYLNNLALVQSKQGRLDDAGPKHEEALAMRRAALPANHRDIAGSLNNLALVRQGQKRLTEAQSLFRDAVQVARAAFPPTHPDLAEILLNYGKLEVELGNRADADKPLRNAQDILKQSRKPGDEELLWATNLPASNTRELGKLDESERLFQEVIASLDTVDPSRSKQELQAYARTGLGMCLMRQQKFAQAEPLLREAEQLTPPHLPEHLEGRRKLLADLYDAWDKAEPGNGYDVKASQSKAKLPSKLQAATEPTTRPGGS